MTLLRVLNLRLETETEGKAYSESIAQYAKVPVAIPHKQTEKVKP